MMKLIVYTDPRKSHIATKWKQSLSVSFLLPEDTNFSQYTYENGGKTEDSNANCFISKFALLQSMLL